VIGVIDTSVSCMIIFSHVNTVRRSRLIWRGLMHVRSDTIDARWRLIKDGEHVGPDGSNSDGGTDLASPKTRRAT
jgi:hypothetical protein